MAKKTGVNYTTGYSKTNRTDPNRINSKISINFFPSGMKWIPKKPRRRGTSSSFETENILLNLLIIAFTLIVYGALTAFMFMIAWWIPFFVYGILAMLIWLAN